MIGAAIVTALLAIALGHRVELFYDIDHFTSTYKVQLTITPESVSEDSDHMTDINGDVEMNTAPRAKPDSSSPRLTVRIPSDAAVASVRRPTALAAINDTIASRWTAIPHTLSHGFLSVDESQTSTTVVSIQGPFAAFSEKATHKSALWTDTNGLIGSAFDWASAIQPAPSHISVAVRHGPTYTLVTPSTASVVNRRLVRRLRIRNARVSSFDADTAPFSTSFLLSPIAPAVLGDVSAFLPTPGHDEAVALAIEHAQGAVPQHNLSTLVVHSAAFALRRVFPPSIVFSTSTSEADITEALAHAVLSARAALSEGDALVVSAMAIAFTATLHPLPTERLCIALRTDSDRHRKPLASLRCDETAALKLAVLLGPLVSSELSSVPLTLNALLEQASRQFDRRWIEMPGYPLVHVDIHPGQSAQLRLRQNAFPMLIRGDSPSSWQLDVSVALEGHGPEVHRLDAGALSIPLAFSLYTHTPLSASPPIDQMQHAQGTLYPRPLTVSPPIRISRDDAVEVERSSSAGEVEKRRRKSRYMVLKAKDSDEWEETPHAESQMSHDSRESPQPDAAPSIAARMAPVALPFARVVYSSRLLRLGMLDACTAPIRILDDAVSAFLARDIGLEALLDTVATVIPCLSLDDGASWDHAHALITSVHLAMEGGNETVKTTISSAIRHVLLARIAPLALSELPLFADSPKQPPAVTIMTMLLEVGEQGAVSLAQDLFNEWRVLKASPDEEESASRGDLVKALMRAAEVYGGDGDCTEVAHIRSGWRQPGDTLCERIRRHYWAQAASVLALLNTSPEDLVLGIPSFVHAVIVWFYLFFKARLFSSWWALLKTASASVAITAPYWSGWNNIVSSGMAYVGFTYYCNLYVDSSFGATPWIILVGFRYALFLWISMQIVYLKDGQEALTFGYYDRKAIMAERMPWRAKAANPAFWHRGVVSYDHISRKRTESYQYTLPSDSESDSEDV